MRRAIRPTIGGAVAVVLALTGCGDDPDPATRPGSIGNGDVVAVAAQPCDRPTARNGLGTRLGDGGVILTAAHTVDGALRNLTVDGGAADLVAIDLDRDLALLASPDTGLDLSDGQPDVAPVEHGDEVEVVVGEADPVVVIIDRTVRLVVDDVTDGRRSERRSHVVRPGLPSGSSGAPVVDREGRLVGVVALTARRVDESFVVAADEVLAFVDEADHAASLSLTDSDRSLTVGACE